MDGDDPAPAPELLGIYGYRADELLANSNLLERIAHPEDRAIVARHLREERQVGSVARQMEFRIVHRSGEERWVGHLCQPIFGRDGDWLGWRGSSRELTERRRFEESLAASEERFRRIFEDAPIGIAMTAADHRFSQANSAFCLMTGYSEEELRELSIEDITHPQDLSKSADLLTRLWKGEIHTHVRLEKLHVKKSGEPFRGLLTATVLSGPGGEAIRGLAMLEDVTERWEADQLREQYASFISHDLMSPLSVVIGQAGIVRKQLVKDGLEPQVRGMDSILKSAWRMNSMIKDLAESTGLESGKWTMQKTPTDLGQLVAGVCEMVVSPEDRPRLRLEQADGLPTVEVDQERLGRAVANLVTNALKYSPRESPVTMSLESSEGRVQFSVIDLGKGIPPEEHALIFERFYRAVSRKKAEGLGLGLYITRLIVDAHGGKVWVKSELGKGSTFGFTLSVSDE